MFRTRLVRCTHEQPVTARRRLHPRAKPMEAGQAPLRPNWLAVDVPHAGCARRGVEGANPFRLAGPFPARAI